MCWPRRWMTQDSWHCARTQTGLQSHEGPVSCEIFVHHGWFQTRPPPEWQGPQEEGLGGWVCDPFKFESAGTFQVVHEKPCDKCAKLLSDENLSHVCNRFSSNTVTNDVTNKLCDKNTTVFDICCEKCGTIASQQCHTIFQKLCGKSSRRKHCDKSSAKKIMW